MHNLILNLRSKSNIKRVSYIFVCLFLALYFFSIPSFSGRSKWNIISYFLMGGLIISTGFYVVVFDKFRFEKRLLIPLIFIFDTLLCTLVYNHNEIRMWLTIVLMWLTFIVIFYAARTINSFRLTLKLLVFALLGFSIYFALIPEYRNKILTFSLSLSDRLGSYFDNVNLVGSYFAIGFGLALYLGLINNNKKDYLYCLACFPFLYLGLFTGSRAFIFLVFILFVAISYIKFKKYKIIYFIILAFFVLILILTVNFIPFLKEQFEKTMYTLFGIGEANPKNIERSAIERVLWMRYGFELGSKNIIIGYGCNGFSKYSGVGTYSHNNFSELLCNFGVPGFLFFYFMIIYPAILSLASKKQGSTLVIPFVLYFLVKSMFGVFYTYKDFYLILSFSYFVTDDVSLNDVKNRISLLFNKKKEYSVNI